MTNVKSRIEKTVGKIPAQISKDRTRDAFRLALQSVLAAAFTFLAMNLLSLPEKFLAVLSTALVLEPSINETIDHAKSRIIATGVGCLIAFSFVNFIPYGAATAISLFAAAFLMNLIVGFKPEWSYGVVGAVAIALGSESDALETSLFRLIAIAVGIVVGIIVSAVVWPDTAARRARKFLSKALHQICYQFELAVKNTMNEEKEGLDKLSNNFNSDITNAKEAASSIKCRDASPTNELIGATELLYNSILIIYRVGIIAPGNVLSKDLEIENKAQEIQKGACEIIICLINNEEVKEESLQAFTNMIQDLEEKVLEMHDDAEDKLHHHAFVFGILEIKESLKTLREKW